MNMNLFWKWIDWQAGACLLVALALSGCSQSGASRDTRAGGGDAAKPIAVKVAEVSRKDIDRSVDVVGSLLPNEEVTVSSEIDGKVDKVFVDIGDQVRKGQTLV